MNDLLIAQLAATPSTLAQLAADADDALLDAAGPDGWSAREILGHLREAEALRFRLTLERLLAEEGPALGTSAERPCAPSPQTLRTRRQELLADFALQRQASLGLLRAVSGEGWRRSGRLPGGGELYAAELLARWVRHDLDHIAALERCLGERLEAVLERRARMRDE